MLLLTATKKNDNSTINISIQNDDVTLLDPNKNVDNTNLSMLRVIIINKFSKIKVVACQHLKRWHVLTPSLCLFHDNLISRSLGHD
jgi:hypothetical protein